MQDTEFIKHIGKIIRFYRLKNNLTQEQLSEYADCSCGFIGQIERGESKISLSVLSKIIKPNSSPPILATKSNGEIL